MAAFALHATLIMTIIFADGVFIRSDRRNTIKHAGGSTEFHDNLNKVFVSADRRVVIYNHGVNAFRQVSWREHAAALAAKIQQSQVTNLAATLDLAAATLDPAVTAELQGNKLDSFAAFVVIVRLPDGRYHAGEVSWKKNEAAQKKPLGRFIRSGSGTKYLQIPELQKTNEHWASLTIKEIRAEVDVLYAAAVKARDSAQGEEFSPAYDDRVVTP